MERRRRDEERRVDVRVRKQLAIIAVEPRHPERFLRPRKLFRDRAACGDEVGVRNPLREFLRVPAAESAEAHNADAQPPGAAQSPTTRFSRHERVAASASSSALMPSLIDVRTGLVSLSASKKCAIS